MTEDEMIRWQNRLEFEQDAGVGDGQGGLVYFSPQGHRVGHNWETELNNFKKEEKNVISSESSVANNNVKLPFTEHLLYTRSFKCFLFSS